MEAVEDWLGYFTQKDYEEQIAALLDKNIEFKDDRILMSRARGAYRAARDLEEQEKVWKLAGRTNPEQLDLPLEDEDRDGPNKNWDTRYHLDLEIRIAPADTVVARKFREIKKNSHEVDDATKVKTVFHSSKPSSKHREQIGSKTVVETGEEEEVVAANVVEYYFNLRTLGYAHAKAGNHQVDSKLYPKTKVQYSDLSANLNYADDALREATRKGLSGRDALAWLEATDLATRGTMVNYMRRGWPHSEAIVQAKREHAIDWRASPTLKRARSPEVEKSSKRPKVNLRTANHYAGKEVCKPHNDSRGCSKRAGDCPLKRAHVCDVVKPDGNVCGSTTHTRPNHK